MPTQLWSKVLTLDLDQSMSSYPFSIRLADENFWTRNFTRKAILEYKKFMYLAATSEHMVSPSPIIDRVWHEHLMFSKSYSDFCDLLGKHIQHVPATHNPAEAEKFRSAKQRTQKLYKEIFGDPPAAIWNYETMYDSLHLAKANIKIRTFIIIGIFVSAALTVLALYLLKPVLLKIGNPTFLDTYLLVALVCFGGLELWNRIRLKEILLQANPESFVFDLQPVELVYLKSLKLYKAINAPINKLIVDHTIKIDKNQRMRLAAKRPPSNLEEYEIFLAFDKYCGSNTYPPLLSLLTKCPVFANISKSMDALKKYIIKSKAFGFVFYVNFTVLAMLLIVGVTRLTMGILRDKPTMYIFWAMIALTVAAAFYLYRVSRLMVTTIIPSYYQRTLVAQRFNASEWEWQYVLLGSSVLAPSFAPLDNYVQKHSSGWDGFSWGTSGWDGSSCGTSSGSSCGSSCSSCGGCGGD
jgi:hypothetical protein